MITGVHFEGSSIFLDLSPVLPAGGFIRPFCDGNTVSLGALQGGAYTVTARAIHPNGTVFPTLLTSLLIVGQVPVPVFSLPMFFLYAGSMLVSGAWLVMRPERLNR
jgi:hypothetical protein